MPTIFPSTFRLFNAIDVFTNLKFVLHNHSEKTTSINGQIISPIFHWYVGR